MIFHIPKVQIETLIPFLYATCAESFTVYCITKVCTEISFLFCITHFEYWEMVLYQNLSPVIVAPHRRNSKIMYKSLSSNSNCAIDLYFQITS